ncbi:unnamed protein product [Coffea canephora]|uniref:COBRA C-terminal domain-containing protein n=1 Tax=Coffea canephora TaxID=49390 RepID=A0A068UAD9_COFCA|nr:unnamed protein product [Coffea canephora]
MRSCMLENTICAIPLHQLFFCLPIYIYNLPNPLPCGDRCGASINWHCLQDFVDGWIKAMPGFEEVYSFNRSVIPDSNNIFKWPSRLKLPCCRNRCAQSKVCPTIRIPLQDMILFIKKKTPGINVTLGDGFPNKVYFNGDECSLPAMLPFFISIY